LAKDSHNSHLPPSSDRFSRQPKSLRKKSGKKPGGQEGHPGKTLMFSACPDEVMVHAVDHCEQCQADLRQVPASLVERRQVVDVTCTPTLTHYAMHASRGRAALDAIDILPHFGGTSVHDGWRSYFLYACAHALCLVHLLRELTFLAEEQGLEWAADLKALLL